MFTMNGPIKSALGAAVVLAIKYSGVVLVGITVLEELSSLFSPMADASKGLPGANTDATHRVKHKVSVPKPTNPVLLTPIYLVKMVGC